MCVCVKSESKLYMCANDEWQVAATGEVFGVVEHDSGIPAD